MSDERQICTFFIDSHCFGVPVSEVQEVLRFQEVTSVPLAPAEVKGMLNLRGQIVMAIDLRRRLGLPGRSSAEDSPMNVIVHTDDGPVSLLVDAIGDVINVDPSTFEIPPDTVQGLVRELLLGVHKLKGQLLHLLDTKKACQIKGHPDSDANRLGRSAATTTH